MQIISHYRLYVLYNPLNIIYFLKMRKAAIEIYFTPHLGGLFHLLLFNNLITDWFSFYILMKIQR